MMVVASSSISARSAAWSSLRGAGMSVVAVKVLSPGA